VSGRVVLIAGAQIADRHAAEERGTTPRRLATQAASQLFDDATSLGLRREHIDHVAATRSDTLWYANLGELVARDTGLAPVSTSIGENGGHGPVQLLGQISQLIADGEMSCVLIVGAEVGRSVRKCHEEVVAPDALDPLAFDDESTIEPVEWTPSQLDWSSDAEYSAGLQRPLEAYALMETSRWIADGYSPDDLQRRMTQIGDEWSALSRAASENPSAWTRREYSSEEITTPSIDNPSAAYPYLRSMCANDRVDMGAAIVVCSEQFALDNNIDLVGSWYVESWVTAQESATLTSRPSLHRVRPYDVMRERFEAFVNGQEPGEMYTCFPSLPAALDPLWLTTPTLYGGLAFGGGPWNNAMLHPLASLVDGSADVDAEAVVIVGNGGYATRHSWLRLTRQPSLLTVEDIGDYPETHELVSVLEETWPIEAFTASADPSGQQCALVAVKKGDRFGTRSILTSRDPAIVAMLQNLRDFRNMPVVTSSFNQLQSIQGLS
jgi:acetyl-CoA C-acetyltransferase